MKRYGQLWEQLISWENLVRAARKARRGKRSRYSVQAFEFGLETELLRLQTELREQTYCPGGFHTHWVHEPKKRLISAAPYRDRVVHHALMNVLEPILDRHFHPDCYACRKGKGTHAAADRLQQLMHRNRYALQCDIQKFFPSIDHTVMKNIFRRLIKDKHILWLMDLIVECSNEQPSEVLWFAGDDLFSPIERRKGLPIGNLTSQWFANWYLNGLDHFVTSRLGMGAYVRYCDDFILLSNDKGALKQALCTVREYLSTLRLKLHPHKLFIRPTRSGMTFVGYRMWMHHRLLKKDNVRRLRRKVRWMQARYAQGELGWKDVKLRLDSWMGHAAHANTRCLIRRLSRDWRFRRDNAESGSCASRRQLEQQCQQLPRRQPEQQQPDESQQQQRVPSFPALSRNCVRNCSVYGRGKRDAESPGVVPELRRVKADSQMCVTLPGWFSRRIVEHPVRSVRKIA